MPPRPRFPSLPALLLALPLLAASGARAADPVCTRPLKVGVSSLGYSTFKRDGRLQGILPELLALLTQRSGCALQLEFRPRARVLLEFGQGRLDLVTATQRTQERDQLGHYVPYAYTEFDLVLRADAGLDSLAALLARPQMSLAVVRGIVMPPALQDLAQRLQSQGRLEQAPDYENLAERMRAGRVLAALVPTTVHAKLLADGLFGGPVFNVDLEESEPIEIGFYFSLTTLSAAEREHLELHLRRLVREGEVRRLYARYLGEGLTERLFGKPPRAPR